MRGVKGWIEAAEGCGLFVFFGLFFPESGAVCVVLSAGSVFLCNRVCGRPGGG